MSFYVVTLIMINLCICDDILRHIFYHLIDDKCTTYTMHKYLHIFRDNKQIEKMLCDIFITKELKKYNVKTIKKLIYKLTKKDIGVVEKLNN